MRTVKRILTPLFLSAALASAYVMANDSDADGVINSEDYCQEDTAETLSKGIAVKKKYGVRSFHATFSVFKQSQTICFYGCP